MLKKTLAITQHTFAGDREITLPYLIVIPTSLDIRQFSQNGIKALAIMAHFNNVRDNSGYVINGNIEDETQNLLQLVYNDNPEIYSPDSCEFLQVESVSSVPQEQIEQQLVMPDDLYINETHIDEIKELQLSIISAVRVAQFTDNVMLPRNLDFMAFERVDENFYLFDSTAYIGKIADIQLSGIDLKIIYAQMSRLTCACDSKQISSLILDDQFHQDHVDKRDWIILAKNPTPNYEASHKQFYEINGDTYFEIDLYSHNHINMILGHISSGLDLQDTDRFNLILEGLKDSFFTKSSEYLTKEIEGILF